MYQLIILQKHCSDDGKLKHMYLILQINLYGYLKFIIVFNLFNVLLLFYLQEDIFATSRPPTPKTTSHEPQKKKEK